MMNKDFYETCTEIAWPHDHPMLQMTKNIQWEHRDIFGVQMFEWCAVYVEQNKTQFTLVTFLITYLPTTVLAPGWNWIRFVFFLSPAKLFIYNIYMHFVSTLFTLSKSLACEIKIIKMSPATDRYMTIDTMYLGGWSGPERCPPRGIKCNRPLTKGQSTI